MPAKTDNLDSEELKGLASLFARLNWHWAGHFVTGANLQDTLDLWDFLELDDALFDAFFANWPKNSVTREFGLRQLRRYYQDHPDVASWVDVLSRDDLRKYKRDGKPAAVPPPKVPPAAQAADSTDVVADASLPGHYSPSDAAAGATTAPPPGSVLGTEEHPLDIPDAGREPLPGDSTDYITGSGLPYAAANGNPSTLAHFSYEAVLSPIEPDRDAAGYWQRWVAKLVVDQPADVLKWYTQFQGEADRVNIALVPLSHFNARCSLIPKNATRAIVMRSGVQLNRKLQEDGILDLSDPSVKMYHTACFGVVPHRLSGYMLLHQVLHDAFQRIERTVSQAPTYSDFRDVVLYADALLAYQQTETVVHKRIFTDVEMTRRFLEDLRASGLDVGHLVTSLELLPQGKRVPPHLHVSALARTIHSDPTVPTRPTGHRAQTRSSTRQGAGGGFRGERKQSAFYQPDKDAFCTACRRGGHKAESCLNWARHLAFAELRESEPALASTVLAKFKETYTKDKSRALARALRLTHAGLGDDDDLDDGAVVAHVEDLLLQDFVLAGQD